MVTVNFTDERATPAVSGASRNGPRRPDIRPGDTILAHTLEVIGGRTGFTTSMRGALQHRALVPVSVQVRGGGRCGLHLALDNGDHQPQPRDGAAAGGPARGPDPLLRGGRDAERVPRQVRARGRAGRRRICCPSSTAIGTWSRGAGSPTRENRNDGRPLQSRGGWFRNVAERQCTVCGRFFCATHGDVEAGHCRRCRSAYARRVAATAAAYTEANRQARPPPATATACAAGATATRPRPSSASTAACSTAPTTPTTTTTATATAAGAASDASRRNHPLRRLQERPA